MNKTDIVDRILKEFPYVPRGLALKAVDLIIEKIELTVKEGGRAEFRNFGSFSQRTRSGYKARSIQSDDPVQYRRRKLPLFKPSPYANNLVNGRAKVNGSSKVSEGA